MNSNKESTGLDLKVKLSTLWIFVLFNIIFLEFHKLLQPGFIEEIITGFMGGVEMTQGVLLLGAIVLEIPIAMLLLSRLLTYEANRWANIIAGAITIMAVVGNVSTDLDNIFFTTIIVAFLSLIIWYAWKWPDPELSPNYKI